MRLRRITLSGFKTFARAQRGDLRPGDHRHRRAERQRQEQPRRRGPLGARRDQRSRAARRSAWTRSSTRAAAAGSGWALAQVELVIDNEEGTLPSEDPEVSVSRRVVAATATPSSASTATTPGCATSSGCSAAPGSPRTAMPSSSRTTSTASSRRPPRSAGRLVEQAAGVTGAARRVRGRLAPARRRRRDRPPPDRPSRGCDAAARRAQRAVRRRVELRDDEPPAHRAARQPRARGVARGARASLKLARSAAWNRRSAGCEAAVEADAAFAHRSERPAHASTSRARARDAAARRLEAARVLRSSAGRVPAAPLRRPRSAPRVAQRGVAVADLRDGPRGGVAAEALAALSGAAAAALDVPATWRPGGAPPSRGATPPPPLSEPPRRR